MDTKIIEKTFDRLESILPNEWDKVIFYAAYSKGSYSMKYFIKNNNSYTDCYSQDGITKGKLVKLFLEIDKILTPYRNNLNDKEKWTVFTLSISSNGKFKTDLDYDDISEKMIAFEKEWKKKYLK